MADLAIKEGPVKKGGIKSLPKGSKPTIKSIGQKISDINMIAETEQDTSASLY